MKATILGSGTSEPSLTKNSSGLLIACEGSLSLVDFGYGNLRQLLKLGVTLHDIDRIFFTHHHPDHMCDLLMFLFSAKYGLTPRTRPLDIIAAPGFEDFFQRFTAAFRHWLIPEAYAIRLIEQDEDTRHHGALTVTSRRVLHIDLSRAYRFESPAGKVLAVSGDTGYCPAMAEVGKDADLLILECSFPEEAGVKSHLTPAAAGRIAREARARKLCLTHLYPSMEPARAKSECALEYGGEIVLAEDLMAFEL